MKDTVVLPQYDEEDLLLENENKSEESFVLETTIVFCDENDDDEYINEDKESYSSDDVFEEEEQEFSDTDDIFNEKSEGRIFKIQQEISTTLKINSFANDVTVIDDHNLELEEDDLFNEESEREVQKIQAEISAAQNKTFLNDVNLDVPNEKSENIVYQQQKIGDKQKYFSNDFRVIDDYDIISEEDDIFNEISDSAVHYQEKIGATKNKICTKNNIFSNGIDNDDLLQNKTLNLKNNFKINKMIEQKRKISSGKIKISFTDSSDKDQTIITEKVKTDNLKENHETRKEAITSEKNKASSDDDEVIFIEKEMVVIDLTEESSIINKYTKEKIIDINENHLTQKDEDDILTKGDNCQSNDQKEFKANNNSKVIKRFKRGRTRKRKRKKARTKLNYNHKDINDINEKCHNAEKDGSNGKNTSQIQPKKIQNEGKKERTKDSKKIIEKTCLKNVTKAIFYPHKDQQIGNSTACRTESDLETDLSTFVAIKSFPQKENTDSVLTALVEEYYSLAREIGNSKQTANCSLDIHNKNLKNFSQTLQNATKNRQNNIQQNIVRKTIIGENFQHTENTIQIDKAILRKAQKTSFLNRNLEIKTYLASNITNFKKTCDLVTVDTLSKKLASVKKLNFLGLQTSEEQLNQVNSKAIIHPETIENKKFKSKSVIENEIHDQSMKPTYERKRKRKKLPPLIPLISKKNKKQMKEPLQSDLKSNQNKTKSSPTPKATYDNSEAINPEVFRKDYGAHEQNSRSLNLFQNTYYEAAEQNLGTINLEVFRTNFNDQYYSNNSATPMRNTFEQYTPNSPYFLELPQNYYEPVNNNFCNAYIEYQNSIDNQTYFGFNEVQPNYWQNHPMDYGFYGDTRCYPTQPFPTQISRVMPSEIQWSCHLCMAKFHQQKQLYGHLGFHVDPQYYYYNCQKCSFTTTNMIQVRQHLEHCIMELKVFENEDFNQRFICHICLEVFSEKLAVHNHIQAHEPSLAEQYGNTPT